MNKIYLCLVVATCMLASNIVFAAEKLILGVHPFVAKEMVVMKFTPLAKYLSKKTGFDIEVRVGSSYDEHIQYIGKNKVDIAYMGPASYVNMRSAYSEKPVLARLEVNGDAFFQGNIVVHKNSGINNIDQLKGKRIAFGDPNSTMSYIVPHHMLHNAGVFLDKMAKHQFLYSHNNVALGVLSGDFDAGAVKPAVFKKFEKEGLLTIAKTPKISEHLFITRSNLEKEKIKALRKAMIEISGSEAGMKALRVIKKSITGLVAAEGNDYDNLRKIISESEELHK